MSDATDIEDDYLHFDAGQLETSVDVVHKLKSGDLTDLGITIIKSDLTNLRKTFGELRLRGTNRILIVPVKELTNVTEMAEGDTITFDSVTWVVKAVRLLKMETEYHCVSTKSR